MPRAWLLICALAGAGVAGAEGNYRDAGEFLRDAFSGDPPAPSILWIGADLRREASAVLDHDPGVLRLRYWARGERTAWVLEEIGKEKPITIGVMVAGGRIDRIEVLVFREERGWEIRYPFFTDQFRGAGLTAQHDLDRSIDGITGATLSVGAMRRVARFALLLHHYAERKHDGD